jgi:mRNA interferase HigB
MGLFLARRPWFAEASKADWSSPADVKKQHRNASIVGNSRVVFIIGGNKYRLVVAFKYEARIAFVRFVGTHAAYDRIDVSPPPARYSGGGPDRGVGQSPPAARSSEWNAEEGEANMSLR